ncbi:hypothetical protein NC651_009805 [Populus alba x Populus x berolinensis]|nr:hypothetical protein NC651_009805 [Populus alba x Populus x berolinensis]
MSSPLPSLQHNHVLIQPTAFADTASATTATFATEENNYPSLLDNSATLFLHGMMPGPNVGCGMSKRQKFLYSIWAPPTTCVLSIKQNIPSASLQTSALQRRSSKATKNN